MIFLQYENEQYKSHFSTPITFITEVHHDAKRVNRIELVCFHEIFKSHCVQLENDCSRTQLFSQGLTGEIPWWWGGTLATE